MTVHLIMLLIKNNRLTSQVWAVIFLSWHHAFHDYNQDHYNSILDHRMAQFHHSAAFLKPIPIVNSLPRSSPDTRKSCSFTNASFP